MTVTALATSVRQDPPPPLTRRPGPGATTAVRAAGAAAVAPGPRLLLPPVSEPRAVLGAAGAFLPPSLRPVHSPAVEAVWPGTTERRPAPPELPDPAAMCGPLVLAVVEALAGTRPLAQLVRWVSPAVLDALASRTSPSPAPRGLRRTTIRRTHVCRIDARTAEASVVVHDGDRVRAAAVRLEARRGHWRATALQIG